MPSLAGPRRPQDRVALTNAASDFRSELGEMLGEAVEHEPKNGSLDQGVAESFPASDSVAVFESGKPPGQAGPRPPLGRRRPALGRRRR